MNFTLTDPDKLTKVHGLVTGIDSRIAEARNMLADLKQILSAPDSYAEGDVALGHNVLDVAALIALGSAIAYARPVLSRGKTRAEEQIENVLGAY